MLLDQGRDMLPYQGITPLVGRVAVGLRRDLFRAVRTAAHPLRHELRPVVETRPTRDIGGGRRDAAAHAQGFALRHWRRIGGGGLLASDILSGDDAENWNRANMLLDTVEELELVGPSVHPTDLLVRLFHEEGPRVFDAQPVDFGCTCSEDRVRQSLSIYSAKDIAQMTTDEGIVTADCQFCGAHYEARPEDARLRGGGWPPDERLTCATG
jgi:molecular chaperone Hsp33